jgi:hypothetical protein
MTSLLSPLLVKIKWKPNGNIARLRDLVLTVRVLMRQS